MQLTKSLNELKEKLDASVAENTKRENLINDLKEEIKVNFLANQELKKQAESAAELEKAIKTELKTKEKELKTEVDKNKVSRASMWRQTWPFMFLIRTNVCRPRAATLVWLLVRRSA